MHAAVKTRTPQPLRTPLLPAACLLTSPPPRPPPPATQTAATAVGPAQGAAGASRINVSEASLEVFLQVLAGNAGLLPSDTLQQFKMVQSAAVQAHPQLAGVVGDSSSLEAFAPDIGGCCLGWWRARGDAEWPGERAWRTAHAWTASAAWPPMCGARGRSPACLPARPSTRWPQPVLLRAEEEANAYFQRVYAGEIAVDGLVEVRAAEEAGSEAGQAQETKQACR